MLHVVIMAGGKGERFWPASRRENPKQFLRLFGEETLIQETYRRARGLTGPDYIYVVSGPDCAQQIREQLSGLPPDNLLIEPEGKNTAACIGLAAVIIERLDPGGVMVVLPSDHRVGNILEFFRVIHLAAEVTLKNQTLVTLGIHPTRPETGYGYMEIGSLEPGFEGVNRVKRFTEKPDSATAKVFLATSLYLWNSGIFVWNVSTILAMFTRYLPDYAQCLRLIQSALGSDVFDEVLKNAYAVMENVSIDYGILERADSVSVIPADLDWDDVGNWRAMRRVWEVDCRGNAVRGGYLPIDSHGNIVYSPEKRVVTLGVSDMIIAESEDCLLILPVERDREIKGVLEKVREHGWDDCL